MVTHFTQIRFYKTDDVTHSSLYTEQLLSAHALVQTGLCTEKLLQTDAFTQRFSRKEAFTQKLLHTDALYKDAFAQRSICEQTPLHTDAFTHRRFHTQKLLHRETFAQNSFYMKKFSSPPYSKKKQANRYRYLSLDLFRFLSFPFQIINASG